MYTANTMASAIEALGMSLPNSSAQAAVSEAKRDDCARAGAAVVRLIEQGIRPRDIMTRKAFENAITMVIALGGSTNAVLHLLAMAHAAGVKLSLDDFTRIGRRVPVLADLKPSGTLRHGGAGEDRRPLAADEEAARTRACCTAMPDRDGQDAGGEPARRGRLPGRPGRHPPASTTPSRRTATS